MTIPLSPASDRRGPRETLLALTEAYLRRGELDVGARHSVAALEGRVRVPAAGVSVPEWAPLAVALAAMLRGEAETAVRLVAETLGTRAFPEALRPALLGIGIRAARAAGRPALAARWHAGLRVRLQRAARGTAQGSERGPTERGREGGDEGPAAGEAADARDRIDGRSAPGPRDAPGALRSRAARLVAQEAVLATLPAPIRELLTEDVYEAGYGAIDEVDGFEALALDRDASEAGAPGGRGGNDAADGTAGDAAADGEGDGAADATGAGRASPGGAGADGGVPPDSDAVLHLVMDAYHGDVVSVPAHVAVLAATHGIPIGEGAMDGAVDGAVDGGLEGDLADGSVLGATLLTIRVAAGRPLPDPPDVAAWHVRFVGRARALDARTSDGSLLDLAWEDGALVATLHPPDWFDELGVEPDVLATRVTHVVVVPETDGAQPA